MKNSISHLNLANIISVVVLAMPVGAMAQSASMPAAHSNAVSSVGTDNVQTGMEMRKSMDGMHEKMRGMSMSGDADYDFAMMMRMHHQGALDMAQAELDKGKNPAMRSAAKRIISSQKKEITQFDHWLAKHKQPEKSMMAK